MLFPVFFLLYTYKNIISLNDTLVCVDDRNTFPKILRVISKYRNIFESCRDIGQVNRLMINRKLSGIFGLLDLFHRILKAALKLLNSQVTVVTLSPSALPKMPPVNKWWPLLNPAHWNSQIFSTQFPLNYKMSCIKCKKSNLRIHECKLKALVHHYNLSWSNGYTLYPLTWEDLLVKIQFFCQCLPNFPKHEVLHIQLSATEDYRKIPSSWFSPSDFQKSFFHILVTYQSQFSTK